jgi:hypothetical protein
MKASASMSCNIPLHNDTSLQSFLSAGGVVGNIATCTEMSPNRARTSFESREVRKHKVLRILDEALALAAEMDNHIQGSEHSSM